VPQMYVNRRRGKSPPAEGKDLPFCHSLGRSTTREFVPEVPVIDSDLDAQLAALRVLDQPLPRCLLLLPFLSLVGAAALVIRLTTQSVFHSGQRRNWLPITQT
jgi:hypothetical protein